MIRKFISIAYLIIELSTVFSDGTSPWKILNLYWESLKRFRASTNRTRAEYKHLFVNCLRSSCTTDVRCTISLNNFPVPCRDNHFSKNEYTFQRLVFNWKKRKKRERDTLLEKWIQFLVEKLLDRTSFCRVHEHVDTNNWWRTTTDFLSFFRSSVANYDSLHAFDRGKKMKGKEKAGRKYRNDIDNRENEGVEGGEERRNWRRKGEKEREGGGGN